VPPPEDYDRRLATACGPWTARFETLDVLFDAHHPHAPHQHLAFLAVQPDLVICLFQRPRRARRGPWTLWV
jgi:hypothetical protein